MKKKITLVLMVIAMTWPVIGCSGDMFSGIRPRAGAPWMQKYLQDAPPGPAKFQRGWKDGCHTGISATSNHLQKFFYKFKQDYELAQTQEYYAGWKTGYLYCQRYMFQYLRRTII